MSSCSLQVPAWQNLDATYSGRAAAVPVRDMHRQEFKRPEVRSAFGKCAAACLSSAAERLIEAAAQLDDWDRRFVSMFGIMTSRIFVSMTECEQGW